MKITVENQGVGVIAEKSGDVELNLVFEHEYSEGDKIVISGCEGKHIWLMLDEAMGSSLVYVTDTVTYTIPFGEKRNNLSPKAFSGKLHIINVREAYDFELTGYRNLACNVNDCHENTYSFPHAAANVETRGEAVFAARNAIDGITANDSHGLWPYSSWGINRNPDAVFELDFGEVVTIDRIVLYLRADFPHDSRWTEVTIAFSDGDRLTVPLKKTHLGQEICFPKKNISRLKLCKLIKADDQSPFPALTQLEVYGRTREN